MKTLNFSLPVQDACFVLYFNHWIPDFWNNAVTVLLNCLHVDLLPFFPLFVSTRVKMTINLFVSLLVSAISLV